MSIVLIFSSNPPLQSNTSNPLIYIQVRTSAVFILFTAIWGSASHYYYYYKQNSVKKCEEEAKDVWWRLEWGLKNTGNESLSLQLDHKWHHCHHLVLISFHLLAPPLQAISGYWVTWGPPLIIFMGTQGQPVLCRDERIFIWMHIMLCSQYSGTFSAYLRIASEAFSSTESLISEGFMCFILPPHQLGLHAWWAG